MTHTPGPWNLNGGPNPTNPRHYTVYVKPEGPETVEHICSVSDRMSPNWEANAKLIASAPDLLNELKYLIGNCQTCGGEGIAYTMIDETEIGQPPGSSGRSCPSCQRARDVIAKAT